MSLGAALILGLLAGVPAAQAAEGGSTPPKSGGSIAAAPDVARGVIVRARSVVGVAAARAVVSRLPMAVEVTQSRRLASGANLLLFDRLLPADEATSIATTLISSGTVTYAEPDLRVQLSATPFIPNDTYFPDMPNLWNGGGTGDYSVKAPLAWSRQKGLSSVVVAVVDSGITPHPDLDANIVAGYDFVSNVAMANDGNARDPDPADPGDWVTQQEATSTAIFKGCAVTNSTWHGTHVGGTVAAVQNNALGITGVAPGVRVQPVRALGKCGGFVSDITDAITWASGGAVPGVPINPTPADVINLSLGGGTVCSQGSAYQVAISGAIARGATVVAAAGNQGRPIEDLSPAGCPGVISVTAVDQRGQIAAYSNYGVLAGQATIAAPGGDFEVDDGILSTSNVGLTTPQPQSAGGAYSFKQGTSMAAPHVAAAAALVVSSGVTDPARVRAALVAAVQPYPARGDRWDCTTLKCGAGILDLGLLNLRQGPAAPGAPTGLRLRASGDAEMTLTWTAPASNGGAAITGYRIEGNAQGGDWALVSVTTTPETSLRMVEAVVGYTYQFRVAAINEAGTGAFSAPSDPFVMPAGGPAGKVDGFSSGSFVKKGKQYQVTVTWRPPANTGGLAITGYQVRVGTASRWGSWAEVTEPSVLVNKLKPKTRYTVEVQAINAFGPGETASYAITTPR